MAAVAQTIADIIRSELELGKKGSRLVEQPNVPTTLRIAELLRKGVRRGIVPQWTLRTAVGVKPSEADLKSIADQVEEAFTSGCEPIDWRIDVYR